MSTNNNPEDTSSTPVASEVPPLMPTQSGTLELHDITIIDRDKLKKAISAAALGNAMEWFDFGVYGFVAFALGKVFFPDASPSVQMIAALGTFSVPFLVRPLGGVFFGVLGDKYGRQKVLAATIILMAISTFCIGLIPSYAAIGIAAPILLLICKVAQGFSVGGEFTGAAIFVAEYSPDRKRGFLGSFLDFGSIAGFLLGAGLVVLLQSLMSDESFLSWGWRVPFFLAAPLGLLGLYLRHAAEETPAFQQQLDRMEKEVEEDPESQSRTSWKEIITRYWKPLLMCIGMVLTTNITYYMLLTYMPSYLTHNLHYSESHGVLIIIAVMVGMLFIQPLIGMASDRIGRRPFVLFGSVALLVLAIPAFHLIISGKIGLIFVGLFMLAILLNCFTGVMASTVPALFPARIRYSALAASFNVAVIIAGLTPTIAAALVDSTGNLYLPAYYLMLAAVIGIVTAIFMKETANKPMRGDSPQASSKKEAKELLVQSYERLEQGVEDMDAEIAKLKEQIEALELRKQQYIDLHPNMN